MTFLGSIDWIFAAVILIGGRYWGSKYFNVSKNPAHNFLAFASAFGAIWIGIKFLTVGIAKAEISNLFITYLVATSFYELLAKRVFEFVEGWLPKKKE